MSNYPIPEEPFYSNQLRMLQDTDPAHADLFNALYGQLLENCEYLKLQDDNHSQNKSNPHSVTKDQVGLGDVPNVTTNNQMPTFTEADADADIVSGEALTVILGKLLKSTRTLRSEKAGVNHKHSAVDITSGTLPVLQGGTGQTTTSGVKSSLGITALENNFANLLDAETIEAARDAGIDLS